MGFEAQLQRGRAFINLSSGVRKEQRRFCVMVSCINWGNKLVVSAVRAFILIDLGREGCIRSTKNVDFSFVWKA